MQIIEALRSSSGRSCLGQSIRLNYPGQNDLAGSELIKSMNGGICGGTIYGRSERRYHADPTAINFHCNRTL